MKPDIQININNENLASLIAFHDEVTIGVDRNGRLYETKKSWNPLKWAYRKFFSQRTDRLEKALKSVVLYSEVDVDASKLNKIVDNTFGTSSKSANRVKNAIKAKTGDQIDTTAAYPSSEAFEREHYTSKLPKASDIDAPISTRITAEIAALIDRKRGLEAEITKLQEEVETKKGNNNREALAETAKQEQIKQEELQRVVEDITLADPKQRAEMNQIIEQSKKRISELKALRG